MERNLINGSGWIFRNGLDTCLLNSIKIVVLASGAGLEPFWTSGNH